MVGVCVFYKVDSMSISQFGNGSNDIGLNIVVMMVCGQHLGLRFALYFGRHWFVWFCLVCVRINTYLLPCRVLLIVFGKSLLNSLIYWLF